LSRQSLVDKSCGLVKMKLYLTVVHVHETYAEEFHPYVIIERLARVDLWELFALGRIEHMRYA
jgi:hypothetical protein